METTFRTSAGSNYILGQSAVPAGLATSGTLLANGTFTIGTAYPTVYANPGIWIRFPGSALVSGTDTWLWCVMSSTTAGTAYTDQTLSTPAVGTGLAYTGYSSEWILVDLPYKGGFLGPNGRIEVDMQCSINNSAGIKQPFWRMGANPAPSLVMSATSSTHTNVSICASSHIRGNQAQEVNSRRSNTSNTVVSTITNIDLTVDGVVSLRLVPTVATDFIVCESYSVRVIPGF